MPDKIKKHAFTMAEVLITLGIIGVVAAMTLPALINDLKNKDLESRFKKSYSVLSQAIQLIIENEYGGVTELSQSDFKAFGNLLRKYMGTSKSVGNINWGNATAGKFIQDNYKTLSGGVPDGKFNDYAFYTKDGTMTVFLDTGHVTTQPEIFIAIDVNNVDNKPNKFGYDFFAFYLDSKGRLLPFGGDETYYPKDSYCIMRSTSSANGYGCTIKALTEPDYFKNLPY